MTVRTPAPLVVAAVVLLLGACGTDDDELTSAERSAGASGDGGSSSGAAGPSTPATPAPEAAAGELALQVADVGGFRPVGQSVGALPRLSVYADGRVVRGAPQIEIFPPPALPALEVVQADPAQVQRLVDEVQASGLDELDLDAQGIADATSLQLVASDDGATTTVEVYGFTEADLPRTPLEQASPGDDVTSGEPGAPRGLQLFSDDQYEALVELADLLEQVRGLAEPGPGETLDSTTYAPRALAVLVEPYAYEPEPELVQPPVAWPGPPFATAPEVGSTGLGCLVVEGDALDPVLETLAEATTLTPFVEDGEEHQVVARPLLPHETGCADLIT